MKLRESIFTKQIETDRNVQTVWCEYAWKMSVNSKGSTLSLKLTRGCHCVVITIHTYTYAKFRTNYLTVKHWHPTKQQNLSPSLPSDNNTRPHADRLYGLNANIE